ncbi:MAG TPA: hypothetical protein VL099_13845 [Candidatus Binatia bacterium]|nr:hypothetical protein [Candidatus Binatia bacterium]
MQQFLRIIEPLLHLRGIRAQSLGGHLHRGSHPGHGWVLAHKAHFVHADAGITFQGGAQLFRKGARSGRGSSRAGREGADEPGERGLRALRGKHDAGDARAGEHSGKALLGGRGFQWNSVQVELVPMRPQQQAAGALSVEHRAQLVPGDFKLRRGPRVPEFIEAGEFQQDVQAADKGACRRDFCIRRHSGPAFRP